VTVSRRALRWPAIAVALAAAVVVPLARSNALAGGFTGELAAGVSGTVLIGSPDDAALPGLAPVVAAAGWQVSARVAVGLRSSSYLVPAAVAGRREPFVASSLGPAVAVWLQPSVVVGAAIGPCLVWPAPVGASPTLRSSRGWGASLRAGWSIGRAAGGDVLLGGELLPAFFARDDMLVGALFTVGLLWR